MTLKVNLPDNLLEQAERSASFDPEKDPFFSDNDFYTGPTPPDLIDNFDKYLYGSDDRSS